MNEALEKMGLDGYDQFGKKYNNWLCSVIKENTKDHGEYVGHMVGIFGYDAVVIFKTCLLGFRFLDDNTDFPFVAELGATVRE